MIGSSWTLRSPRTIPETYSLWDTHRARHDTERAFSSPTHYRINLSPFTKDFRVCGAIIERCRICLGWQKCDLLSLDRNLRPSWRQEMCDFHQNCVQNCKMSCRLAKVWGLSTFSRETLDKLSTLLPSLGTIEKPSTHPAYTGSLFSIPAGNVIDRSHEWVSCYTPKIVGLFPELSAMYTRDRPAFLQKQGMRSFNDRLLLNRG